MNFGLIAMQEFFFIRAGKEYLKVNFQDIQWIQAEKRHVIIVTAEKKYVSCVPIGEVERLLPKKWFCRVHRSYIISLKHTDKFDDELAYVANKKIPIAKQHRTVLKEAIVILSCQNGSPKTAIQSLFITSANGHEH